MEKVEDGFPPKKNPARQLDFNSVSGGHVPHKETVMSSTVVFPEHPHWLVIAPRASQLRQFPLHQPPLRPVKPESPKAQPRQNVDAKDGTPKKQKQCKCKHSRCLKLYCECFALGVYCDGCNCVNCHNNVVNEPARREAVEITLERNPDAFRTKIANMPHGRNLNNMEEATEGAILEKHNKGCHCKKSGCLKGYCECFQADILCSEKCKCMDCKNFEGSEERKALLNMKSVNNHDMLDLQQVANAALAGTIGISGYGSSSVSKKRKAQELLSGGPAAKDSSFHRLTQFQQTDHVKASTPLSSLHSVPGARVTNNAPVGHSKYSYRSLLADLISSEDLKELCAVLVVYAREAARVLSDDQNAKDKMTTTKNEEILKTSNTDESLSGARTDKPGPDGSVSDGTDGLETRPISPGTQALMCDEHDTVFTDSDSNGLGDYGRVTYGNLLNGQVITDTYFEQEKIVLTTFRDCLNKLITFGELRETQCSLLARSQSQMEAVKSFTDNTCWDGFPGSTVAPSTELSQNNDNCIHSKIPFYDLYCNCVLYLMNIVYKEGPIYRTIQSNTRNNH